MNNKYIFSLLIALLFIPLSVQSVTVTNSIFTGTMKAGSSTTFNMIFTPDPPEKSVNFEVIEVTGDQCASWVKVNKTSMNFDKSTPVSALITVPKDAENGLHRCDIIFTTPAAGMVKAAISVPLKINVRDGTNPTPTIAAIQTVEPAITTIKPIATTIKPTEQAPAPESAAPDISFSLLIAASLIVIGVIGVFIAFMVWWKK